MLYIYYIYINVYCDISFFNCKDLENWIKLPSDYKESSCLCNILFFLKVSSNLNKMDYTYVESLIKWQSSIKGTLCHVADRIWLSRDSSWYPDCYQANSIHDSNNNNYSNNADDLTNLGDGSLYHAFRCGSKHC